MTTTLLCYWCNDLTDPEKGYVPLGVLVREEDKIAFKIKKYQELPLEQQPQDRFMRSMFDDKTVERIFHATTEASRGQPLSLHFVAIDSNTEGTLEQKADALFESHVNNYYSKPTK